jgi:hypothetical protein
MMSAEEIQRITGCKTSTFTELSKMSEKELKKKLKQYGYIIFLYELKSDPTTLMGHWMIILDRPGNVVEVFDSHGSEINPLEWYRDQKILEHVDESQMNHFKLEPILGNKLYRCGYKYIDWNTVELQEKSPKNTLCGNWCLMRLLFHEKHPEMDIDTFSELFV